MLTVFNILFETGWNQNKADQSGALDKYNSLAVLKRMKKSDHKVVVDIIDVNVLKKLDRERTVRKSEALKAVEIDAIPVDPSKNIEQTFAGMMDKEHLDKLQQLAAHKLDKYTHLTQLSELHGKGQLTAMEVKLAINQKEREEELLKDELAQHERELAMQDEGYIPSEIEILETKKTRTRLHQRKILLGKHEPDNKKPKTMIKPSYHHRKNWTETAGSYMDTMMTWIPFVISQNDVEELARFKSTNTGICKHGRQRLICKQCNEIDENEDAENVFGLRESKSFKEEPEANIENKPTFKTQQTVAEQAQSAMYSLFGLSEQLPHEDVKVVKREHEPPVKPDAIEGWLEKMTHRFFGNTYQKQYFRINEELQCIEYSKYEKSSEFQTIALSMVTDVTADELNDCVFSINIPDGEKMFLYTLKAPDVETASLWVRAVADWKHYFEVLKITGKNKKMPGKKF